MVSFNISGEVGGKPGDRRMIEQNRGFDLDVEFEGKIAEKLKASHSNSPLSILRQTGEDGKSAWCEQVWTNNVCELFHIR